MEIERRVALSAWWKAMGLRNAEIADLLRVDVSSVSRYLKQAEDSGWLSQQYSVNLPRELAEQVQPAARDPELEASLWGALSGSPGAHPNAQRVGREGIVVVRKLESGTARRRDQADAWKSEPMLMSRMAIEGARLLLDRLGQRERCESTTLGITWGRSVGQLVECLSNMVLPEFPNVSIVSLQGGVGRGHVAAPFMAPYYPDTLAERLRLLLHATNPPSLITMPGYVRRETASAVGHGGMEAIWRFIEDDVSFQQAVEAHRRLDVAVVGVGGFEPGAWALRSGHVTDQEMVTELLSEGARGDIACRVYRDGPEEPIEGPGRGACGTPAILGMNHRAIGISLTDLRSRVEAGARVIAVGGGSRGAKGLALRAAVRNGFATDVVTDEATARAILRHEAEYRTRQPSDTSNRVVG
jgi:DNA-binding transcriptional regulator LsrR (DeoR family)